MEKRYNLKSGRRECHIPFQLQLAGDEEFLVGSLRSPSGTGQVLVPSKHDHMGPMWAIGGQIAIWVL